MCRLGGGRWILVVLRLEGREHRTTRRRRARDRLPALLGRARAAGHRVVPRVHHAVLLRVGLCVGAVCHVRHRLDAKWLL